MRKWRRCSSSIRRWQRCSGCCRGSRSVQRSRISKCCRSMSKQCEQQDHFRVQWLGCTDRRTWCRSSGIQHRRLQPHQYLAYTCNRNHYNQNNNWEHSQKSKHTGTQKWPSPRLGFLGTHEVGHGKHSCQRCYLHHLQDCCRFEVLRCSEGQNGLRTIRRNRLGRGGQTNKLGIRSLCGLLIRFQQVFQ